MSEVDDVLARVKLSDDVEKYARQFATFEEVWDNCDRADWMLQLLDVLRVAKTKPLRLFICRLARRWWHFLSDLRSQRAVEAAEKFARGEISRGAMEYMRESADKAAIDLADASRPILNRAARVAALALHENVIEAAMEASRLASLAEHAINDTMSDLHEAEIMLEQALLLKELMGNPFRRG